MSSPPPYPDAPTIPMSIFSFVILAQSPCIISGANIGPFSIGPCLLAPKGQPKRQPRAAPWEYRRQNKKP